MVLWLSWMQAQHCQPGRPAEHLHEIQQLPIRHWGKELVGLHLEMVWKYLRLQRILA
jgi:hypothetical protein